jgi:hypothetical protein
MSNTTYYDVDINYGTHTAKRMVLANGMLEAIEKAINESIVETDRPVRVQVIENEDLYNEGWY